VISVRAMYRSFCYRFFTVASIGAYSVLNVLLQVVHSFAAAWPTYAVTAITVPPMVLSMIYVVIPFARRFQIQRA